MLSEKLESFRIRKALSIKEFCEKTTMGMPQYSKYIHERKIFLSVKDAVKLLAAFPDDITVNTLLSWIEHKPLHLSSRFPRFGFSYNEEYDREETEKIFRKFYIKTVIELFDPGEAIMLLNAMVMPWDGNTIGLPFTENIYALMDCLRIIRKTRFTKFSIPAQTVLTHFQRKRLIIRFGELCEYERAFKSGGVYLISELMYQNMIKEYGIRLWLSDES